MLTTRESALQKPIFERVTIAFPSLSSTAEEMAVRHLKTLTIAASIQRPFGSRRQALELILDRRRRHAETRRILPRIGSVPANHGETNHALF
jgi:hypothetical protein